MLEQLRPQYIKYRDGLIVGHAGEQVHIRCLAQPQAIVRAVRVAA